MLYTVLAEYGDKKFDYEELKKDAIPRSFIRLLNFIGEGISGF